MDIRKTHNAVCLLIHFDNSSSFGSLETIAHNDYVIVMKKTWLLCSGLQKVISSFKLSNTNKSFTACKYGEKIDFNKNSKDVQLTRPLRINSSTAFATPSSSPVQKTYCAISSAEYCPPLCALNKYSAFYKTNFNRINIIGINYVINLSGKSNDN